MIRDEQKFLSSLEAKLWTAADKLRSTLDAAQYKHTVLGLLFVKYVSDAFETRRKELREAIKTESHEYYIDRNDYETEEEYQQVVEAELEERDNYSETNTFWVPKKARWKILKENAKIPAGAELPWKNAKGEPEKMRSVGWLIDNALETIERENSKLKGILNKQYTGLRIDQSKLGELIDLLSTIPFDHESLQAKDILGHVYEYFLGQFALAEGKKGGQFYTPKSIVRLIVEMLQPTKGRVYDPAMGSGGFFVQSERFIQEHQGSIGDVSIYGQEYNHTTWQLAAMNMVIRGMDFNFGKEPENTFANDQHPDLKADYIMANPPFNMKEWNSNVADDDPRWSYGGTPPKNNANFAWLQHMLYHLAPKGSMGLLLANGSMSSSTNNEGTIRRTLIEKDLIECMVALPGQLFTNTQIPACIWFLTKNKAAQKGKRDRKKQVLFIDARNLGYMKDRVLRDFKDEDIQKITDAYHNWQQGKNYEDEAGFCKATTLDEIEQHDFVLTPGRYVGAPEEEEDSEPFAEKMTRLTTQLKTQFAESNQLETEIKNNLKGLGYEL